MALGEEDICLNWTPLYHDMGLVNNFFLCLATGMPLALLGPQDFVRQPALWLRGLSDTRATTTWSPNFGFALAAERIEDEELDGVRLGRVRALWNAAERIHAETMDKFSQRFREYGLGEHAVKTNFGCAENVGGATFSNPDGPHLVETVDADKLSREGVAVTIDPAAGAPRAVRVVGVGRPNEGLEIEILSRTGSPKPDGHVGELVLKTPSRMEGYLGDAHATSRALNQGVLWTGDRAYKRGEEIFWVGRSTERINSMGRKFDPSDFEAALLDIPELRPGCFAAFGIDDSASGSQKVIVVCEVRNADLASPWQVAAAVRRNVAQRVGAHVSEVLLVPKGTLAKTSSGKRRHRKFRQLYEEGKLQALDLSRSQETSRAK
jgi:acyl-CoA synthetase (AMP-forming)/AMP-acid ligase II